MGREQIKQMVNDVLSDNIEAATEILKQELGERIQQKVEDSTSKIEYIPKEQEGNEG